jgi:hypothetical protein
MVPGLEERLLNGGSEEEILHIADLVCCYDYIFLQAPDIEISRYKKDLLMLGLTTQRVSRARSLTGLRLGVVHWIHHLHVTSRLTGAFIMIGLELCFVPPT